MDTVSAPFIITAALDDAAFAHFDAARRRWFPPERNLIPAHVSLFHALPAERRDAVLADVAEVAAATRIMTVAVRPPVSIGRGVAYPLDATELARPHAALRAKWRELLRPQDLQGFRPHVVVQNKVDPTVARATLAELAAAPFPERARVVGIDVWRYLGGPWEFVRREPFAQD